MFRPHSVIEPRTPGSKLLPPDRSKYFQSLHFAKRRNVKTVKVQAEVGYAVAVCPCHVEEMHVAGLHAHQQHHAFGIILLQEVAVTRCVLAEYALSHVKESTRRVTRSVGIKS